MSPSIAARSPCDLGWWFPESELLLQVGITLPQGISLPESSQDGCWCILGPQEGTTMTSNALLLPGQKWWVFILSWLIGTSNTIQPWKNSRC